MTHLPFVVRVPDLFPSTKKHRGRSQRKSSVSACARACGFHLIIVPFTRSCGLFKGLRSIHDPYRISIPMGSLPGFMKKRVNFSVSFLIS